MTSDQSEAWLAGRLEGEGYFGTITNRVGGYAYRYARVGVSMTDADVVDRVAALWEASVHEVKPSGVSKKVTYRCLLVGTRAVHWMERLYPFMGERRRAQIDAALHEWREREDTATRRRRACSLAASRRQKRPDGTFLPSNSAD